MRFGLHYTLQSPECNWVESYEECLKQIVVAEKHGFSSVLIAEHHFKPDGVVPSPFVVCGAIAAQTKSIRIGPGVSLLPLHHPIDIAEQTCVLDVLSKGRAILGVGLGNTPEEFTGFGIPMPERAKRMEEGLSSVKRLLSEPKVSFSGLFYSFENIAITPRPVQKPRPPIWVGAEKSERSIRRAAKYGDAWIVSPLIPPRLLSKYVGVYDAAIREHGHNNQPPVRPMRRDVYIAKDSGRAWAEAEKGLINQYYNGYLKWGAMVDDEGRLLRYDEINKEDFMEVVRRRVTIGGPEDLIKDCENLRSQFGITDLILRIQFPGLEYEKGLVAIGLIGEQVLPHLRNS